MDFDITIFGRFVAGWSVQNMTPDTINLLSLHQHFYKDIPYMVMSVVIY